MKFISPLLPIILNSFALLLLISTPVQASIGGDEVLVMTGGNPQLVSIDAAIDGTLYAATDYDEETTGFEIRIYRSQDGGLTWILWGKIADPDPDHGYYRPSLHVAEGAVNRCFVAYKSAYLGQTATEIHVAYSDLALSQGDFSNRTVALAGANKDFDNPDLTSDAVNYSSFYLFLVADEYQPGLTTGSSRIWYARSINRGDTFTNSMVLDSKTSSGMHDPDISYGFGNYLHVAWSRHSGDWSQVDYRRGTSTGTTIDTWDDVQTLQTPDETRYELNPQVAASPTTDEVVVVCERRYDVYIGFLWDEPGVLASTDQGGTFPVSSLITNGGENVADLVLRPTAGEWVLVGGTDGILGLQRATSADFTDWSDPEILAEDVSFSLGGAAAAVDPTHADRLGLFFRSYPWGSSEIYLKFDAEWFGDPGYPNLAEGFPVDLSDHPLSPPAVADIDGDDDLEIIFGDAGGNVQIYDHDGVPHPGWPQNVAAGLSRGPVAVGDLNSDGLLEIAAGASNGFAHLWDHTGQLLWTRQIERLVTDPVQVSIGALGPPYHRYVVMTGGERVRIINRNGRSQGTNPGALGGLIEHAAAIGDVDGDGVPEWIATAGNQVVSGHLLDTAVPFSVTLPASASDAPTLGDLDLDGDVEVIVPTETGVLHVLDDDGTPFPGSWPFTSPNPIQLTSAPVAQVRGTNPPEIAVGSDDQVFLFNSDGSITSGYPVSTGSPVRITGAPILGAVEGSPDVILGSRNAFGWAWDNFGQVVTGWPKEVSDQIQLSPAMGDLDLDGLTEVVLLSYNQLIVVDVNDSFGGSGSLLWAMYGHDARRSGCADCPEDLVSGVEDEEGNMTRVSFAGSRPNPLTGPCLFRYALPSRARVSLEIFDLRGHRIATVTREEADPGEHVIGWSGCDRAGRPVPGGQYLARLEVRGPKLNEQLTRKITVLP